MSISDGHMTLLLTEWIFIYSTYRFMRVFFERETCKNRIIEIISYLIFAVLNSIGFLFFHYPALQGISATVMTILLTFNYQGSLKKRITATIVINSSMLFAEALAVAIIMGMPNVFEKMDNDGTVLAAIMSRVLVLVMVLIIEKFCNLKNGNEVPFVYWIIVIAVPLADSILFMQMSTLGLDSKVYIISGIAILTTNCLIILLYDSIVGMQAKLENAIIVDMENHSYKRQLELMGEYINSNRMLRHDIKNHIISVKGLIEKEQKEEALIYIQNAIDLYQLNGESINSGNTELDGMLNYKLSQSKRLGIQMEVQLSIPANIPVRNVDFSIILGNLLDNAMEALQRVEEGKKKLFVSIRYSKGRVLICIRNPYVGKLLVKNNQILTIKKDAVAHGVGLRSVKSVIEKYQGEMNLKMENQVFEVNIILYTK